MSAFEIRTRIENLNEITQNEVGGLDRASVQYHKIVKEYRVSYNRLALEFYTERVRIDEENK
jgi:hypothetical protein